MGLLLFGPPGTGKTMVAKALAQETNSIFFSISASSLTSKYMGESEKLVRGLFQMAELLKPSIIFIDEVDSLLSSRCSNENDASRRMKTEFLVRMDGVTSDNSPGIVLIGATNKPEVLDEAMLRRFVKRLKIPLPDVADRKHMIEKLLRTVKHKLSDAELLTLAQRTADFSGAEIANLCADAAMNPIRLPEEELLLLTADQMRPIEFADFELSLQAVRPCTPKSTLLALDAWNKEFGSG